MSNFIKVNFKDGWTYVSHKKRLGLDIAPVPETGEVLFYAVGNQITREEYDRLCKEVGMSNG